MNIQDLLLNKLQQMVIDVDELKSRESITRQVELFRPKTVNVASMTIPALAPAERRVISIPTGTLIYPKAALVGFFLTSVSVSDIQNLYARPSIDPGSVMLGNCLATSFVSSITVPVINPNLMLYLNEDYAQAQRWAIMSSNGVAERDASGNGFPDGRFTYAAINNGLLVGYYVMGSTPIPGFCKTDKKIVLESAWLSGGNANFALRNIDSTANTAATVRAAFYE